MKIKHLVLVAIEILRKNSYPSPVAIEDKMDFQRQRKPGNDHLDWAVWFLKPLELLNLPQKIALLAYWQEPPGWQWTEHRMRDADDALTRFEKEVDPKLIRQGERIAARY